MPREARSDAFAMASARVLGTRGSFMACRGGAADRGRDLGRRPPASGGLGRCVVLGTVIGAEILAAAGSRPAAPPLTPFARAREAPLATPAAWDDVSEPAPSSPGSASLSAALISLSVLSCVDFDSGEPRE